MEPETKTEVRTEYVQRHVIVESARGSYELSDMDSDEFRRWAFSLAQKMERMDHIQCTFNEKTMCKLVGNGEPEVLELTGGQSDRLNSMLGGMFRGKLENVRMVSCTLRMDHDVCQGIGTKAIPSEDLKKGDIILRLVDTPDTEQPKEMANDAG